ncbi:MAG: hypothetical protein ABIH36_02665 [bacterium]
MTNSMRTKVKHNKELVYGTGNVLGVWRRLKGLLVGKGPKDPVAWQRRMRRDRVR